MNAPRPPDDVVSRRVLLVSGGAIAVLLVAIAAFFAFRGRTAPLWVTRPSASQTAP